MSGPPDSTVPPAAPPGPPPGPPPGYPPYPPYPPYPWYPPPPARNDSALILVIVLVVVILVAVPVVLAAILYVMVSGLITSPEPPSMFLLGPPDLTNGNASIPVHADAAPMNPAELRIRLQANDSASAFANLPPPDGSVAVTTGPYTLRVFWLDNNRDRWVGGTDAFWITGDLSPLPAATSFEFTLLFTTGRGETSIWWETP